VNITSFLTQKQGLGGNINSDNHTHDYWTRLNL